MGFLVQFGSQESVAELQKNKETITLGISCYNGKHFGEDSGNGSYSKAKYLVSEIVGVLRKPEKTSGQGNCLCGNKHPS